MTATDYLSKPLNEVSYNFEFKHVSVYKNGNLLGSIQETIYIRQGGMAGIMTTLSYNCAIEKIKALGAMRDFRVGRYQFFASWRYINTTPPSIIQYENDSIQTIKMTALEDDIVLEFEVGDYIIVCDNCWNLF